MAIASFLFLAGFGIADGEFGAGILTLIFVAIGVYTWARLRSNDVQEAKFYDEFVRVRGRRLTRDIQYSSIDRVATVKKFPWWEPRSQVSIRLVGEERPLIMLGNPTNTKLKLNLDVWLGEQVAQSGS